MPADGRGIPIAPGLVMGKCDITPRTDTAWKRTYEEETRRYFGTTATVLGARSMKLFGGPANLVTLAAALADGVTPFAERVYCAKDDYIAAGLARNGPSTTIALKPKFMSLAAFDRPLSPDDHSRRRVELIPSAACPRGEIRLDEPL